LGSDASGRRRQRVVRTHARADRTPGVVQSAPMVWICELSLSTADCRLYAGCLPPPRTVSRGIGRGEGCFR
jgi:hypothetical protein